MHEKIEIWKKRIKSTPGHWHSEAVQKKLQQATMIGRASNRNQKILSVFAQKSNFARKFLNLEKRAKSTPGHWHSEAVQRIPPSCDDRQGLK